MRSTHALVHRGFPVRERKPSRLLAALLTPLLFGTLLAQVPAGPAAAAAEIPKPKDVTGVKVKAVKVTQRPEWTADARELTEADLPEDPEDSEGTAMVDLTPAGASPAVGVGSQAAGSKGVRAGALPVLVAPVALAGRPGAAAQGPAGVMSQRGSTPGAAPRKVRVQVLGAAASAKVGVTGMVVNLSRADGVTEPAQTRVTLDYRKLAATLGGDALSRLRVVRLSDGQPLPTDDDPKAGTLSATVSLAATGVTAVAVAAAPSGENGDYTATKLTPASMWQVSQQTGAFSWSYPITMPAPPSGVAPELALSYNSAAIDGRTSGNNTQGSEVGDGWDVAPGFIERSYRSCRDDRDEEEKKDPNNKDVDGGDLCWYNDNAAMSFNGSATELVKVTATDGGDKDKRVQYRPVNDDGSRIELVKGAVDNGDDDKEYWRVTTVDGTQHFFGRDQGEGGSSADTRTDSVLTVPVYSNHPDDPGYDKEFAKSRATRAWRWNLDYTVDPNGNTITYFYDREAGAYAREGDEDKRTTYDRGSVLKRIEYGSRRDAAASVRPAARVSLDYADRCVGTCFKADGKPIKKRFPDTPWDQYCDKAPCKTQFSPTFWTQKRLDKIITQTYAGSADKYTNVDSWKLAQTYLQAGGNESTPMWLKSITRTGMATGAGGPAVTLPPVVFNPNADIMPNRVDTPNGHSSLFRSRVDTITTESGAQIGVTYSKPACDGKALPKPWNNTSRCYPQYYGAEGEKPKIDWFNKYVVTRLDVYDNTGGFEHQQTNYDYLDTPAWAYDDSELVKPKKRTWGQFRGYGRVLVRQGVESETQSATEYLYFRGMNGDKQPKDEKLPPTGTPRSVLVEDSQKEKVADHPAFAGQVREEITYNGPGSDWISGTINMPEAQGPTASTANLQSYRVHTATVRQRTKLASGAARWTRTSTKVNSDNLPTEVDDIGDEADPKDDRCTTTGYARNESAWILDRVRQVKRLGVRCGTDNVPTDNVPTDKVLSDVRTYFDDPDTFGAPPVQGLPVRVEQLDHWDGKTPKYVNLRKTGYDVLGRVTSQFDALDRQTTTKYTPELVGPLTETLVTNPALQSTTTVFDRALGVPVKTVDANGATTHKTYDGVGRLLSVWAPGRDKNTYPKDPSVSYAYQLRKDASSTVTTRTLTAYGKSSYRTRVQLYDGLLRERQTQTQTVSGGRHITDTVYDSRGLVDWTSSPYYDMENAAPATTLVTTAGRPEIPAVTQNLYDGAARLTDAMFIVNGDEKRRTHTAYDGEKTSVIPPAGGIATTAITDARGRKAQLRQYLDPAQTGRDDAKFDVITYGYTGRDELESVTNKPAGAKDGITWSYGYDLRGNRIETKDPDNGVSTSDYDAANRVVWRKDGRGKLLYFDYDKLGRKTAQRQGSESGPVMASWAYDSLPNGKGRLTRSTRFEPPGAANGYETAVTGYDLAGRPEGTTTTVPSGEAALCASGGSDPCTYTQSMTYRPNGAIDKVKYPAVGGLPAENVTTLYNGIGLPTGVYGKQIYVQDVVYNQLDQMIGKNLGEHGARVGLTYGFDEATGRQSSFTAVGELKSEIYDLSYDYNNAGSITAIRDTPDDNQPADTQCFGYDYLRRLTEAWTPASATCTNSPAPNVALGGPAPYRRSYSYDTAGNRRTETVHGATAAANTTRTYGYPAPGGPGSKPHAVTKVTASGASAVTQQYAYDNAGNMTCRPSSGTVTNICNADGAAGTDSQALTWNDDGKVAKTNDKVGETSYLYDADGNRLIRRDPTGATLYLPGGTEIRRPKVGSVAATRYYSHVGATVAVRTPTGLTWQVNDHQGTATAAVASSNLAVTRRRVLPFGDIRGTKPTLWAGDQGFVGGTMDNTGLTHLGAREYDPGLGRFISVDPLMDLDDPQQWNAYNYANDTPLTLSDPTGLCGIWGPSDPWCNSDPAPEKTKPDDDDHKGKGKGKGNGNGNGNGSGSGSGNGGNATPSPSPGPAPVVPSATPTNDNRCNGPCIGMAKGGRQNVRDSGLRDVTDDELKGLERKAKGADKRRYQKELKARGLKHTGASDSRPKPNPAPPGGGNKSAGDDNDTAERAVVAAGAGIGIGAILWWSAKLLSPLCGPAAPVCVVVL